MIYTYNKDSILFEKIKKYKIALIFLLIFSMGVISSMVFSSRITKTISEEASVIILNEKNKFTEEKLRDYILELNIKFPEIILAQSKLETSNYESNIFLSNNNLFGMKVATMRPTTALGEENGHAYYSNWRQSVIDYGFYQAAYLKDIKTEEQYFQYLSINYAEDPNYIEKVKSKMN